MNEPEKKPEEKEEKKEETPPTLGVSVEEKITTTEKVG